jgi:glutamate synthase (NADPH/NADH) small chain
MDQAPEKKKNIKTIAKTKTPMPEQDAAVRARNWNEVALGYTEEMAVAEAGRCIECKKPCCIGGCPVEIDIPAFIKAIEEREFRKAYDIIRQDNILPAICGRVCPQEHQCELVCTIAGKQEPVAIGRLERFVADWERRNGSDRKKVWRVRRNGHKVAIVGSGPAGLTCASDLALKGYEVTIFEALHAVGGVLVYGIPEFRLPKAIVQEDVLHLMDLGVEVRTNTVVGKTVTIDQLMGEMGYEAVFIGTGAGTPKFMGIPGENLKGVYSANEFLTRVNLMRANQFPEYDTPIKKGERVAVIGAGDTAMDCVRTAIRMGAKEAHIVYRRSKAEMGARLEDYEHAHEEGAIFDWLTLPVRMIGDKIVEMGAGDAGNGNGWCHRTCV